MAPSVGDEGYSVWTIKFFFSHEQLQRVQQKSAKHSTISAWVANNSLQVGVVDVVGGRVN